MMLPEFCQIALHGNPQVRKAQQLAVFSPASLETSEKARTRWKSVMVTSWTFRFFSFSGRIPLPQGARFHNINS